MKKAVIWTLLAIAFHFSNGQTARRSLTPTIVLQFVHMAGDKVLVADSVCQNSFGEQYTVTRFRYYISNLTFKSMSGGSKTVKLDTVFLIDERNPASKQMALAVPAGSYDQISFLLGIDSMKNVSGAQTGALDPTLDMFWTWNTGYVMAKLEGNAPVSKLPRHMIEYHIGGFAGQHNVARTVSLRTPDKQPIVITGSGKQQINITANVNAWFSGTHQLRIAEQAACTSVGALAQQYADNYSNMFAIQSIVRE